MEGESIAANAIAEALGIGHIVGVSSQGQAAMGYARQKITLSYNAMWLEASATQTESGFFTVVPGMGGSRLATSAARTAPAPGGKGFRRSRSTTRYGRGLWSCLGCRRQRIARKSA